MSTPKDKLKRMKEFGEFLRSLRMEKNNVSVRMVAKAIDVSDPYLYQVENGKKALTDPEFFNRIADYFNIHVEELLKKAGYLRERDNEKEKIEKAFTHVINDPKFQFGSRMRGKYDLDAKRFIIEVYEKMTKRKVLDRK